MSIKERLMESIKQSEDLISDELSIRFIILIGSQATSMTGPMSDVDIAVYLIQRDLIVIPAILISS